jgi:hypothetical protein
VWFLHLYNSLRFVTARSLLAQLSSQGASGDQPLDSELKLMDILFYIAIGIFLAFIFVTVAMDKSR